MEYIDRIFYRKINPSDFKKLYDIDKPEKGGGQTYLEAAGISNEALVDFLEYAEVSDSPLKDENRSIYTFNAYVLGKKMQSDFIEFAPRGGRNNYRISRQNMRYKHPAWRLENNFPEPNKDSNGNYTSEGNFEGIIDNLVIFIIRTTYRKYYVAFINFATIPNEWPKGIGLEKLFEGERRGVLNLSRYNVQFVDSFNNPFGKTETVHYLEGGTNILLYGVPGSGKSHTIKNKYCKDADEIERVVFHPDYTYGDFVGQILPITDPDTGRIRYEFTAGPFTRILSDAYNNPAKKYCLIIEEINRGNAPAIFGDIFQLLDRDENGNGSYEITNADIASKMYFGNQNLQKVKLPSNLFIFATMNTSDQNVFTLDTAFQRRWNMRMVENDVYKSKLANNNILDTTIKWADFANTINDLIITKNVGMSSSEDKRLGAYFVTDKDLYFFTTKDGITQEEADDRNNNFPEKVLKYLWDDAFKFVRDEVFNNEYDSLEKLIKAFESANGDERFIIFAEDIFGINKE